MARLQLRVLSSNNQGIKQKVGINIKKDKGNSMLKKEVLVPNMIGLA
jgi:hypothetical protein